MKSSDSSGGILSGVLANIYLHQFDYWVMKTLKNKYDIRYTSYADDFIISTRNSEEIYEVLEECKSFLTVTDTEQLKELNRWVYKTINYYYFKSTGKRLPKNTLKKLEFPSMELLYYKYRKN